MNIKLWQNGEKAKLGDLWHKEYDNIFTTFDGKPIYPSFILISSKIKTPVNIDFTRVFLVHPRGIEPPARGLGMWIFIFFMLCRIILSLDIKALFIFSFPYFFVRMGTILSKQYPNSTQ